MEWLVYWYDSNKNAIVPRNVFALSVTFSSEVELIRKEVRKNPRFTFEEFSKELLGSAMYSFWCKAEHETVLTSLLPGRAKLKIDVYDQLRMNWEHFSRYVWNTMHEEALL